MLFCFSAAVMTLDTQLYSLQHEEDVVTEDEEMTEIRLINRVTAPVQKIQHFTFFPFIFIRRTTGLFHLKT